MDATTRLTDLIGRPVTAADGRRCGRVTDVAVDHATRFPRVVALAFRRRRRLTVVPWRCVERVAPDQVVLGRAEPTSIAGGVYLARDLLDAQVVDIAGRRLARVGDIVLDQRGTELRAVAVDVGLAPVVRRLGLRRVAARLPSEMIAWDALHCATGRGHELQLASPAAAVHGLQPEQLAEVISRLHPDRGAEILAAVPAARARRVPRRRRRRRYSMMRARRRAPS
ncbi:MAG TPA: PRC-barrel domain-containing protein [Solirubrobacteraceae bacterium]|nr:PRC-barrel domain-containing protein [Solirubrobacteraceae bacterium]